MKLRMVRVCNRVPGLCFRFRLSKPRIKLRAPPLQSNPAYNSIKETHKEEYYDDDNEVGSSFNSDTPRSSEYSNGTSKSEGNRIMIVVDSSREAKGALNWALSHTVQKEDTVVLLHIGKPCKTGSNTQNDVNPKAYGLLYSMKSVCQSRRPGVQVEVVALAGKEKGPVIVEQATEHKASLLVLGHRKRSVGWRFFMRWMGRNRSSQSIVDYCIQNADCMTIAVRRKSKKLGGYLITTKRHKNFWLLA